MAILNFELCPRCCHIHKLPVEELKPMIWSETAKKMRCHICGFLYKMPQCERLIEIARHTKGLSK
jgi:hypothetical protein